METRAVAATTDEDEIAHKAFRRSHPGLVVEYVDDFNCNDMFQKNLRRGPVQGPVDPLALNIINSPRKRDSQKSYEPQAVTNMSDGENLDETNNQSQHDTYSNWEPEYLSSEDGGENSPKSLDVFDNKNEENFEKAEDDIDTEVRKALSSPPGHLYKETEKRNYSSDSSMGSYSNIRGKT